MFDWITTEQQYEEARLAAGRPSNTRDLPACRNMHPISSGSYIQTGAWAS